MKRHLSLIVITVCLLVITASAGSCGGKAAKPTSKTQKAPAPISPAGTNTTGLPLSLADGISISTFASGLGNPRVIAWDLEGTMLVSIPANGQVVALPDKDNNGVTDRVVTVVDGLNNPHGIAFTVAQPGKAYIAEEDQVGVYDYDPTALKATKKKKIIDLPAGGAHITRTIMFLPTPEDSKLLISVGSSMNVGYETDWRRAKILVANPDGRGPLAYASGLRNAVFMAVNPSTKQVWATEMGRDYLGDNLPPDEINIIEDGKDYGWPTCFGKNVHDTNFDTKNYPAGVDPCAGKTPAHIDIPAHSAPLGLDFFDGKGWPAGYGHDMLVAYHGSWNRSVPTGYKVVRYRLDSDGGVLGVEDFITGWLQPDGSALGRPVGISIRDNGVLYISDDNAGVIYRVTASK